MQPKFTLKNLGFFFTKIIAIVMIFAGSTQISYAQKNLPNASQKPGYENILNNFEKQKAEQSLKNIAPGKNTGSVSASSVGLAPVQMGAKINNPDNPTAGNPDSRAFCYNGPAGAFQLNKQSVLNTILTPIGAPIAAVFPGALVHRSGGGGGV